MRASWEALHASLVRSVRTLHAHQTFVALKRADPTLAAFRDPPAVAAFLAAGGGDLDAKDALLAALVRHAQARPHAPLSMALLWLGLWPGLDALYRRRLRHFAFDASELVSEVAHAFTTLVGRLDTTSVTRVAATLVRSTERDLMVARKASWAEEARARTALPNASPTFEGIAELEAAAVARWTSPDDSVLDRPIGDTDTDDFAALRAWLVRVVGADAELVLAVLVLEETQREAGARLGLSNEAARKRFQRALARLRAHVRSSMSQGETAACV